MKRVVQQSNLNKVLQKAHWRKPLQSCPRQLANKVKVKGCPERKKKRKAKGRELKQARDFWKIHRDFVG